MGGRGRTGIDEGHFSEQVVDGGVDSGLIAFHEVFESCKAAWVVDCWSPRGV